MSYSLCLPHTNKPLLPILNVPKAKVHPAADSQEP